MQAASAAPLQRLQQDLVQLQTRADAERAAAAGKLAEAEAAKTQLTARVAELQAAAAQHQVQVSAAAAAADFAGRSSFLMNLLRPPFAETMLC